MSIRAATPADWSTINALLRSASLPVADLTAASTAMFAVYERDQQVLGAVALEPRDATTAMVRSLVVAPQSRRSGVGAALTAFIEAQARQRGLHGLYLLTDSADSFFANRGYERTDRSEAPASISSHEQFRSLCPASAAFMRKVLI